MADLSTDLSELPAVRDAGDVETSVESGDNPVKGGKYVITSATIKPRQPGGDEEFVRVSRESWEKFKPPIRETHFFHTILNPLRENPEQLEKVDEKLPKDKRYAKAAKIRAKIKQPVSAICIELTNYEGSKQDLKDWEQRLGIKPGIAISFYAPSEVYDGHIYDRNVPPMVNCPDWPPFENTEVHIGSNELIEKNGIAPRGFQMFDSAAKPWIRWYEGNSPMAADKDHPDGATKLKDAEGFRKLLAEMKNTYHLNDAAIDHMMQRIEEAFQFMGYRQPTAELPDKLRDVMQLTYQGTLAAKPQLTHTPHTSRRG